MNAHKFWRSTPDLVQLQPGPAFFNLFTAEGKHPSSKSVSWSGGGGGGGWGPSCIKIGYSEPRGAESREGSLTLAESSRLT